MGRNFIASHLEGDVADAQNVTLVDSTGDNAMDDANDSARVTIVSGGAAGTEFNEDAAASGGEAGPAILGVRRDADTTPVSLDGDFHQFIFDNVGALKTHVKTSALPSGAATSANQLADGHNVTVDNASGGSAVNIQDGGNAITVDNGGTFIVQEDGAALTALQLIDDIVFTDDTSTHATGTTKGAGIMAAATPTDGSVSANDIGMLAMSTDRRLHTDTDITASVALDVSAATVTVDLGANNDVTATGNVAHDAVDSGNPIKGGGKAIAHGTNPTAVAADDRTDHYFNRAGIPFVIGGHPNVITREVTVTDSDGAQTGISLASVAAGNKIIVTSVQAITSSKNSKPIEVRVAFSTTTTLPTASTTGVDGVLLSSASLAKGEEISRGDGSGIIGIGADDEDLRYTCEDPVNGDVRIVASFYTVES